MVFMMADMAVNCSLSRQSSLFFFNSQDKHFTRFGSSRMTSKEPARKPSSLTQARVFCKTGQGSDVTSNLADHEIVLKQARVQFSKEVAYHKQDSEVSLVKALLLISAEDEAFMSLNREKDKLAARTEGRDSPHFQVDVSGNNDDGFPIAGRTMPMWLSRFDFLAGEVKDILAFKGSDSKPIEILRAVNTVLFGIQGFKKSLTSSDIRNHYLHLVMTLGSGSGLLLCIIYVEVCRRIGIKVGLVEVGGEALVWPLVDNVQECFEPQEGGRSWFLDLLAAQHQSHLFDNTTKSLVYGLNATMQFPSSRHILGMALKSLKTIHWKDACKAWPGLNLTDALHPFVYANGRLTEMSAGALLRPQQLRLALMASERLLLLQPHNWLLRRDHGLLLYHSRRYGEAVQELSICTAFAPTSEAQILEHFVEKLHLLRVESSWTSVRPPPNAPSALA